MKFLCYNYDDSELFLVFPLLQDQLLSGNALRFLGLERSQFEDDSKEEVAIET